MTFKFREEIDYTIAKSEGKKLRAPKSKYPFNKLQIGEEFIIEYDEKILKSVRSLAGRFNMKTDLKFSVHHDRYTNKIHVGRIS